MNYIFDARYRLSDVRAHRVLTSSALVTLLLLALAISVASWLLLFALGDLADSLLEAVAFIATGTAAGLLLLFTFGATYFPYRRLPHTTTELLERRSTFLNVASAASFDLIQHIGPIAKKEDIAACLMALLEDSVVQGIIERLQVNSEDLTDTLATIVIPELTWPHFAERMFELAVGSDSQEVAAEHVFAVFLLHPALHTYLRQHNLREQDIEFVLWWAASRRRYARAQQRWWDPDQLLQFTGIGLSWASGYTPFIDQFTRIPSGNLWDIPFGHFAQVDQLTVALARQRQSNVLLVGQPGVGRLGIVKELARRIDHNQAHPALNGQRVAYLHIAQMLSLASSNAEQLAVISRALSEMEKAGNIIAVLDGIGSILGEGKEMRVNLSDVLVPFFSSQAVRVVAIMSTDEYHLRFSSNQELLQYFEVVHVPELSPDTTLQLLALTTPVWEKKTGILLPYKPLREIVENTASVMPQIPFPEKAYDILEEALVVAQSAQRSALTVEEVNQIISHKIGVDIGKLQLEEKDHLLRLEEIIHRRVINQEKGVAAVARAMIRARAGVRNLDRPIGTFLFLGPTGVGKTETAKALAEAYFGSQDYLQRIDMSEFQDPESLKGLIGDVEHPTGNLTNLIADHPFAVLLLDEFEKAHRTVQQLFLQVFDEGHISDARGRRYSFKHAIIIATSNAGAEFIRQEISSSGTLPENFDTQLREHILRQNILSPELLNRFDGVITFVPLTSDHIRKIAALMLRKLNQRLDAEHGVTVAVTDELVDYLVQIGYNPEFGARPMARAIQDTVEYAVARRLLSGEAQPGQEIVLQPQSLQQAVA